MVAQRKERVFLMVCGWVVLAIDFAQADMEIPCVDYLVSICVPIYVFSCYGVF